MHQDSSPPPIESVPIESIAVGERRREDYGDIQALARSIDRYGLIQPIVIGDGGQLVAGGRRLRACRLLGWDAIPAVYRSALSDAELRAIELEENTQRKPLSPYEEAKEMLARATEAVSSGIPDETPPSAKGGRPKSPDSVRSRAEALGVPRTTIAEADQHVAAAEAHPLFQDPAWKQYQVLEAADHLKKLPEPEQAEAVALIDQPGIPPQAALPILANLARMPGDERRQVFVLSASEDSRDRDLALTTAAQKPPMPDPRLTVLKEALREARRCASMFPGDPATPYIEAVVENLRVAIVKVKELTHVEAPVVRLA